MATETQSAPAAPAVSLPPATPPDPRRWIALAVVLSAAFLGPLDFTVVNVSIPSIQRTLGALDSEIQLVIAVYGLAYAVLLITGGRLGDLYGRKRVFMIGMSGFTFASACCGFAQTPQQLILFRMMQGGMGAMMFPQVLATLQVMFPPEERPMAFGLFGVVVGLGAFSGNLVGGLLVNWNLMNLSWRPVFLVNVPLGILAVTVAALVVPESQAPGRRRLDLGGVALASVGLFCLIFPMAEGREAGWPPWAFACLAAGVVILIAFVYFERWVSARGGSPLVELGLFGDHAFAAGFVCSFVLYLGPPSFALVLTVLLQRGRGFNALDAGMVFAPFALAYLIAALTAVRLATRLGRGLLSLGLMVMIAGMGMMVAVIFEEQFGPHGVWVILGMVVYGIGQGMVMPTLLRMVLANVPHADAGSAAGVLTTVQQVAMSLGIALLGSLFFSLLGPKPPPLALHASTVGLLGIPSGSAALVALSEQSVARQLQSVYPSAAAYTLLVNVGLLVVTLCLVRLLPHAAASVPDLAATVAE